VATVHYWAAAREAAGCSSEEVDVGSVSALRVVLAARGPALARVLPISSLLVDGCRVAVGDDLSLSAEAVVEVLPPFAGG
jgi:molybdopterin converting factor small subunit